MRTSRRRTIAARRPALRRYVEPPQPLFPRFLAGGKNMTRELLAPAIARKSLHNTYRYAGGTVSVLLSGADTGGEFAVWEAVQRPGGEPPRHLHHTSDETFFVMEGAIRFMVGDRILDAPE